LRVLTASNESDIDAAFANFAQQPGAALTIGTDTFFFSRRDQLVGLAARYAIPTIYFHRTFGLAGGLITYGATFHRRATHGGTIRRQNSGWREAEQLADPAAEQIRACRQSQNSASARTDDQSRFLLRADEAIE
jgi:putative ABC transport system substrate-binding protein